MIFLDDVFSHFLEKANLSRKGLESRMSGLYASDLDSDGDFNWNSSYTPTLGQLLGGRTSAAYPWSSKVTSSSSLFSRIMPTLSMPRLVDSILVGCHDEGRKRTPEDFETDAYRTYAHSIGGAQHRCIDYNFMHISSLASVLDLYMTLMYKELVARSMYRVFPDWSGTTHHIQLDFHLSAYNEDRKKWDDSVKFAGNLNISKKYYQKILDHADWDATARAINKESLLINQRQKVEAHIVNGFYKYASSKQRNEYRDVNRHADYAAGALAAVWAYHRSTMDDERMMGSYTRDGLLPTALPRKYRPDRIIRAAFDILTSMKADDDDMIYVRMDDLKTLLIKSESTPDDIRSMMKKTEYSPMDEGSGYTALKLSKVLLLRDILKGSDRTPPVKEKGWVYNTYYSASRDDNDWIDSNDHHLCAAEHTVAMFIIRHLQAALASDGVMNGFESQHHFKKYFASQWDGAYSIDSGTSNVWAGDLNRLRGRRIDLVQKGHYADRFKFRNETGVLDGLHGLDHRLPWYGYEGKTELNLLYRFESMRRFNIYDSGGVLSFLEDYPAIKEAFLSARQGRNIYLPNYLFERKSAKFAFDWTYYNRMSQEHPSKKPNSTVSVTDRPDKKDLLPFEVEKDGDAR